MTTTVASPLRVLPRSSGMPASRAVRLLTRHVVPFCAVAAVLARLPFAWRPPTPDEAGFLLVGRQWQAGGTSLYGSYWVDRPPLLITLFQVAADAGGLVPLRLIGCLATATVVAGSGDIARRIAGPRAAAWTAAVAAALCVSPLLGGLAVDGELLAAPFVAVGVSAVLRSVGERRAGRAALAAAVAGAATVAALLVKQNMADVGVFAVVAVLLARHRGELSAARLRVVAATYVAGAVVTLMVAVGWTLAHGSSPEGVFVALYPFRIVAGHVMAASSHQYADLRLRSLLESWAVSGGAVIMALVAWALASRRLSGAAVWGLVATMAYDMVSVGLGGNYWLHYLLQLVVPVAVISGVLVATRQRAVKPVLVSALVVAAVAWGVALIGPDGSLTWSVGRAVGRAAGGNDTIVTVFGHADVTAASGLSSPYPYLWSLPARTLDPRLTTLDTMLAGPHPATWFVAWSNLGSRGPGGRATERLLSLRYRPVVDLGGPIVYLLDGVERPLPRIAVSGSGAGPGRR